jgi:hypothetical protein
VRNGAVIAAWAGALFVLIAFGADAGIAYGIGLAATVLVGVLIGRWWALLAPLGAFPVVFVVAFASDPSCSDCGEDPWSLQLLYGIVLAVLPATTAMLVGVSLGRGGRALARRRRSRQRARPAP